jgi:formylglycine-generating enzyme required for sulfatase activity
MPLPNADDPSRTTDHAPDPVLAPPTETAVSGARLAPEDGKASPLPAGKATITHQPRQGEPGDGASAALSAPSPSIPGYEIEAVLGRGGMGVVYKARHLALKRTVALKMAPLGGQAAPQERARFRREAEAAARLQHPNIVQIHDVGEAGGHPYCALEFVEGGNLAQMLAGRPLPARESARLVETLARAMQLAHSRNVVHRDLKPANVLLTGDGTPKITDFGLARQLDDDSGQTQAGQVMGTPSYMAPEQASGSSHAAGPAADVYALGAILYECLSGRPPFRGKTVVETLDQVRTREPARLPAGVPADLETVCLKCLRKEPEKRYASAAELADDLGRYQRGEPIQARPVGRVERAVKWVRRNPVVAGAAAAVALALAVGATVSYLKYLDAEREKGVAEHQTEIAQGKEQEARKEADKATKARDFLVNIFKLAQTDVKGGNVTVREILADAEQKIPVEFADQPELRAELMQAIGEVKRGIGRRTPQAMLLEARGTVRLQSAAGAEKTAAAQALVNLDDRLTLAADAQAQLVFLSDFHKERLKPGREATVDSRGCEPADAVLERDDGVLMTFVRLPKGTFYMGWDGSPGSPRKTEIKEDFEIAVHDVTQGQWQAVMGDNPSSFSRKGDNRDAVLDISDEELKLFPVEMVSWEQAQEFIKKLNEKERGRGYLYRLPTEAEWEYACRGGATSLDECSYHFYLDKPTNDLSSKQANFAGDQPLGKEPKGPYLARPTRVGAYPPNKLGLCDMHGNVWQWCADLLDPRGEDRVVRGGSWHWDGSVLRAAHREGYLPALKDMDLGFRLARVPVP